ncbi:hypothetical protein ACHQM5_019123 [Ranunculus cassubicifolius]
MNLLHLPYRSLSITNLKLKTTIMAASSGHLLSNKRNLSKKEDKEVNFEELQAMTLPQLRTMSKNYGISSKGSKQDLIATFKCLLDNEKEGGSSSTTSDIKPSGLETSSISNGTPSKRKPKKITGEDQAQNSYLVTEGFQQKKRRGKSSKDDGSSVEVHSENFVTEQTISIKTKRVSGTKPSIKKKVSLQIENEDGGSVGLLEKSSEPWTILAHTKPQKGWIPYNPRTMRSPPLDHGTNFVKLTSWNVNGLRALLKLDSFSAFAQRENFDILCLQETKLQEKDVEKIKESLIDGYENSFWTCSVSKLGYSGTAIISRMKPLSVKYGIGILDHDSEGRIVTAEFDTFYLINGYVPNSGDGLRRLTYRVEQWDPSLANYMKELEKSKPVILTGDLNCAHQEIDIYNPAGNKRSAGFTIEERQSFEANFLSNGFVDTFRRQHPGVVGYTYWGYRHNGRVGNKGWRLDYFLVSESIADKVHDSYIVPDVTGSDHCPIGIVLKI